MYARYKMIEDVRLVFDHDDDRDDASWNMLLSAYVHTLGHRDILRGKNHTLNPLVKLGSYCDRFDLCGMIWTNSEHVCQVQ